MVNLTSIFRAIRDRMQVNVRRMLVAGNSESFAADIPSDLFLHRFVYLLKLRHKQPQFFGSPPPCAA